MRQVTKAATKAFAERRCFSKSNTEVRITANGRVELCLHGNVIATRFPRGASPVLLTLAGFPTVTTRERLNGLLQTLGIRARVYQRDHRQWVGLPSGVDVYIGPGDEFFFNRQGQVEVL